MLAYQLLIARCVAGIDPALIAQGDPDIVPIEFGTRKPFKQRHRRAAAGHRQAGAATGRQAVLQGTGDVERQCFGQGRSIGEAMFTGIRARRSRHIRLYQLVHLRPPAPSCRRCRPWAARRTAPGLADRIDPAPGRIQFVAAHEQREIALDDIRQQSLVGIELRRLDASRPCRAADQPAAVAWSRRESSPGWSA